ncbi:hypothetical protein Peetri_00079 [Pseudomonas phage vB_PpuM-Peetri]
MTDATLDTYGDVLVQDAAKIITDFVDNVIAPVTLASDKDYPAKFKVLKTKLAQMAGSAMSLPISVVVMRNLPFYVLLSSPKQVSHIITLAKAMMPEGLPLKALGATYHENVVNILSQVLVERGVGEMFLGNRLADLPKSPVTEAERKEDPFAPVDHDDDNVHELSRMLSPQGAPWYITNDQIRAARKDAGGSMDAAMVMVSERHAKRHLVELVNAALLFKLPVTHPYPISEYSAEDWWVKEIAGIASSLVPLTADQYRAIHIARNFARLVFDTIKAPSDEELVYQFRSRWDTEDEWSGWTSTTKDVFDTRKERHAQELTLKLHEFRVLRVMPEVSNDIPN